MPTINRIFLKRSRAILLFAVTMLMTLFSPGNSNAAFHDWYITEVYSSADGSVQFIEMTAQSGGQGLFHSFGGDPAVRSTNSAGVSVFNISVDVANVTAGKSLIFGTSSLTNVPGGLKPDFIIPPNFVRLPTPGSSAMVRFDASAYGTPIYTNLPVDGDSSLTRLGGAFVTTFGTALNSPKNFSNQSNTIVPVKFLSGQLADTNIFVAFKTAKGVNGSAGPKYTMEYTGLLNVPNWTSNRVVVGNGAVVSVTNSTTDSMQRFFRLRVP